MPVVLNSTSPSSAGKMNCRISLRGFSLLIVWCGCLWKIRATLLSTNQWSSYGMEISSVTKYILGIIPIETTFAYLPLSIIGLLLIVAVEQKTSVLYQSFLVSFFRLKNIFNKCYTFYVFTQMMNISWMFETKTISMQILLEMNGPMD